MMTEETRISAFEGRGGRIIQARLQRNTDLLTGIIAVCRERQVETGIILNCIGSLRSAALSWAVPADTKRGSSRTPPIPIPGPIEFISGQGMVCALQERPVIHFHGTLVDQWGRAWAGHFFQGGNPVHSTMDITIQEIAGVGMRWHLDEEIDLEIPVPFSTSL